MWFSIIACLVCFLLTTIMFTPQLRAVPFYQAIAFYFMFEGVWNLLNGIIVLVWSTSSFMLLIHHIGVVVFAGYLFYCIYAHYWHNKKIELDQTLDKKHLKNNDNKPEDK